MTDKNQQISIKTPSRTGRSGPRLTLRMAPMIDIIFLLLIFFLVAAKWRPAEDFLPLELPRASAATAAPGRTEPLAIYLFPTDAGAEVQIGQEATVPLPDENLSPALAELMEQLSDIMTRQGRHTGDPIEIITHSRLEWRYLAKIYNLFYGAGLSDITFQMTETTQDD